MANLEAIKEYLSEEQFNAVNDALKDKDIFVGNGQFIPKSRFDEVNNKLKETDMMLSAKSSELEEKAKQVVDIDSLKNEYQSKIDNLTKELDSTKKTYEIKSALQEGNAKHIDLLMSKVNVAELTDSESIKAKVESLKKEYGDLFGTAPTKVGGQPQTDTRDAENELRQKLGLKKI